MGLTRDDGTLLAGAEIVAYTNYVTADGENVRVEVDRAAMFAFKQESNIWFPSAVWTGLFLLLFLGSLLGLDRIEQREKREAEEVAEPESLAVPINQ